MSNEEFSSPFYLLGSFLSDISLSLDEPMPPPQSVLGASPGGTGAFCWSSSSNDVEGEPVPSAHVMLR